MTTAAKSAALDDLAIPPPAPRTPWMSLETR